MRTVSCIDYADQRYYSNQFGRFMTPDPYTSSARPKEPIAWNRYSYAEGDSINGNDPTGRDTCFLNEPSCTPWCFADPFLPGPVPLAPECFDPGPAPAPPPPPAPRPKRRPTTIKIEQNADWTNRDCYTSFRDRNTGAFAERDILWGVYDQFGGFMDLVTIREILTIVDAKVCPTGTTRNGNQCIGNYGPPGGYFLDSLSASPTFGNATYEQSFQVTTLPNVDGYEGVFDVYVVIFSNYKLGGVDV